MSKAAPFDYSGEKAREVSFPLGGIGTGSHRAVRRRPADRLGDPQPAQPRASPTASRTSPCGPNRAARSSMPASSTGPTSATGPATSRPTPRATSASARGAIRSPACRTSPRNTFEGRFPVAAAAASTTGAFPGTVELDGVQPVHPAERPRFEHARGDVRDRASPTPTDAAIDYTAVGVLGHGLRPPTKAGRVDRRGHDRRQDRDRRARPRPRPTMRSWCSRPMPPTTSRQVHLYRGHWFDALEVYWKDLQPARSVRRARLRHRATRRRRHGPQSRQQPGRRPCQRAAGRDPHRPFRDQPGTRRTSANTG